MNTKEIAKPNKYERLDEMFSPYSPCGGGLLFWLPGDCGRARCECDRCDRKGQVFLKQSSDRNATRICDGELVYFHKGATGILLGHNPLEIWKFNSDS